MSSNLHCTPHKQSPALLFSRLPLFLILVLPPSLLLSAQAIVWRSVLDGNSTKAHRPDLSFQKLAPCCWSVLCVCSFSSGPFFSLSVWTYLKLVHLHRTLIYFPLTPHVPSSPHLNSPLLLTFSFHWLNPLILNIPFHTKHLSPKIFNNCIYLPPSDYHFTSYLLLHKQLLELHLFLVLLLHLPSTLQTSSIWFHIHHCVTLILTYFVQKSNFNIDCAQHRKDNCPFT